jgi:hypothetical protein
VLRGLLRVRHPVAPTGTAYGRVLVVELILVAAALPLGLWGNHRIRQVLARRAEAGIGELPHHQQAFRQRHAAGTVRPARPRPGHWYGQVPAGAATAFTSVSSSAGVPGTGTWPRSLTRAADATEQYTDAFTHRVL